MSDLLACFTDMLKDHILIEQGGTDRIRAFYLKHKDRQLYGRMQSTYFLFTPEGIIITGDLCPGNDSRNSGVHAFGYGLDWFVGRLSESYICEKFLTESWHCELAAEWCFDKEKDILVGKYDLEIKSLEKWANERRAITEEALDIRADIMSPDLTSSADDQEEVRKLKQWRTQELARVAEARAKLRLARKNLAYDYLRLGQDIENGDEDVRHFRDELYRLERWESSEGMPGYDYSPRSRYLLLALQRKFAECYWANKDKAATSIGSVDLSEILPGGPIG